ncbi:hypothetical protein FN846DRAFT_896761 [Sphaerosporella brunnea]|uniref:Uncharacterized protein n=1 Tax=Sphaerosporella brunnea TaxID=1250544 RepID=A0A5J5EAS7_9PEZI|nr:hypothetical protein FN846DRAFT_896761 [Sphaerosporella brunnea]
MSPLLEITASLIYIYLHRSSPIRRVLDCLTAPASHVTTASNVRRVIVTTAPYVLAIYSIILFLLSQRLIAAVGSYPLFTSQNAYQHSAPSRSANLAGTGCSASSSWAATVTTSSFSASSSWAATATTSGLSTSCSRAAAVTPSGLSTSCSRAAAVTTSGFPGLIANILCLTASIW